MPVLHLETPIIALVGYAWGSRGEGLLWLWFEECRVLRGSCLALDCPSMYDPPRSLVISGEGFDSLEGWVCMRCVLVCLLSWVASRAGLAC